MFGFFKKKQTDVPNTKLKTDGPIISALLLEGTSFPADVFLKLAAKATFGGRAVSDIHRGEEDIFGFRVGDEVVMLALMPVPYPASDIEGPLATSWMWPAQTSIESVKNHRSHLLVTMMGGTADRIQRRLILTEITALATTQAGVMAVYWPEATLVHYPPIFVAMAEANNMPDTPPLYLWVDLRVFKNKDGTTGLFTTGLTHLGHMEIEIRSIDMEPGELREWVVNMVYYLLENGPILKHGQTVGISAEHQIRISHVASSFGHSGKVIRLGP